MDRFYIITNSDKDKKLEITEKIADYLKTHPLLPEEVCHLLPEQ